MSSFSDTQPSIEDTLRDTAAALSAVFVQDALATGALAARAGKYAEAASALTPLARTKGAPLAVLDLLARVEAQRGRTERAAFLWERVLEGDAENDAALAGLAAIRRSKRRAQSDEREVADLICNAEAVVTTARDGAVLGWSEAAAAMFGWSADEILGQSVGALFTKKHARLDLRDVRDVLRGREVSGARVRCLRRNRVEFVAYCDLNAVLDASGAVVGVRRSFRSAS